MNILFYLFIFLLDFFYCNEHVLASYLVWRGWLTESVNLVDGKYVQGLICNYSLLQGSSMNFLNHME
jgi:hypothetical protein